MGWVMALIVGLMLAVGLFQVLPPCPEGTPPGPLTYEYSEACAHCIPQEPTMTPIFPFTPFPTWEPVTEIVYYGTCEEWDNPTDCWDETLGTVDYCVCPVIGQPVEATPTIEPTVITTPTPVITNQVWYNHYGWIFGGQIATGSGSGEYATNLDYPGSCGASVRVGSFVKLVHKFYDQGNGWGPPLRWNVFPPFDFVEVTNEWELTQGYFGANQDWGSESDRQAIYDYLLVYYGLTAQQGLVRNYQGYKVQTWDKFHFRTDYGRLYDIDVWISDVCYGIPENLPTPTPSPTPPGAIDCSVWGTIDEIPIVDGGGYSVTPGDCITILPAFGIDLPEVGSFEGRYVGWNEFAICPEWVSFDPVRVIDFVLPVEIMILPAVMFLIGLIIKL